MTSIFIYDTLITVNDLQILFQEVEKMKNGFLEESDKTALAAMLISLSIHEIWNEQNRYERSGDFEKALEVQKVDDAITIVLDYLEK